MATLLLLIPIRERQSDLRRQPSIIIVLALHLLASAAPLFPGAQSPPRPSVDQGATAAARGDARRCFFLEKEGGESQKTRRRCFFSSPSSSVSTSTSTSSSLLFSLPQQKKQASPNSTAGSPSATRSSTSPSWARTSRRSTLCTLT